MSQEKKERVGILMPPSQVAEIDALYPLHGHASRSDFVCKAVEFYTGFLQQGSSEFYMDKTTLAFLEEQLGRLENRICRQLFRICVEQEMACHMFASQCLGEPKETLEELRKTCVRDVKRTTGSIRYDRIYAYQRGGLEPEEDAVAVSEDEGIPILGSGEQTFELAGKIYNLLLQG